MEAASLAVTGIDPFHPLRPAIDEKEALTRLFQDIRRAMKPTVLAPSSPDTTRRSI